MNGHFALSGVPPYLIVDPVSFYAELYLLQAGSYGVPQILGAEDSLSLMVAPGLDKTLAELFGWPVKVKVQER